MPEAVGSAGDTGLTSVTVELTGHMAGVLWVLGTTAQECEGWWDQSGLNLQGEFSIVKFPKTIRYA